MQLEDKDVHTVLNSFDVMGGSHTFTAIWTSAKFRDENPEMYKAFVAALKEATDIVDNDRGKAAQLLDRGFRIPSFRSTWSTKSSSGPQVHWTMVPENTIKLPTSWPASAQRRRSRRRGRIISSRKSTA